MDVALGRFIQTLSPDSTQPVWAAGGSLEFAIPHACLGDGGPVEVTISVSRASILLERHPSRQPLRLDRPGPDFAARHWRA